MFSVLLDVTKLFFLQFNVLLLSLSFHMSCYVFYVFVQIVKRNFLSVLNCLPLVVLSFVTCVTHVVLLNALSKHHNIYYFSVSVKKVRINEDWSVLRYALSDIFVILNLKEMKRMGIKV